MRIFTFLLTLDQINDIILATIYFWGCVMKRRLTQNLKIWKNLDVERMPLLLYGARQIGKTYLLKEFGANEYKNTVYLNFEEEPALKYLFSDSVDPRKLIPKIEKYFNSQILPGATLLIFDEIQSCNRALTSLKYFCENAPEYDVIGAGSLLGVHISSGEYSFPVGKVITQTMYPMCFEEFLWESDKTVFADTIKECFDTNAPMEQALHESLTALYLEYLIVGGMPLAVVKYFKNDNALNYLDVQKIIIDTYVSDMGKYADKSQSVKIIGAYDSIVPQLAKENRKFQYKMIAKGARASLFGDSIDWLVRAGVVIKCEKITRGDAPPNICKDVSAFKLYMADTGLTSYRANLTMDKKSTFDNTFMGGITENYVATALTANGYELFYWESDASAEVDFVIVKNGDVIPIEVKTGDNTRSYSLNSYMKKYNPAYAIRISGKNFGFANGVKFVPFYAAYLI